jgi:3-oxoacyl-[acyl-carrier protein] reductase
VDLGLAGRVVMVSGSSRGIGRAAATLFGAEGANVTVTYCQNREEAEVTATEVRQAGGTAMVAHFDLTAPDSIRAATRATLDRWGRVDVLVNNAVVWVPSMKARKGPFEDFPADEWQSLLRPNIEGTMAAVQAVLPSMRHGGWGRIVNVSSVAAVDGFSEYAWYSAAKAALHGLTRTLAKELGPAGILVNVVMPGGTLTETLRRNVPSEQLQRKAELLPIRRLPAPQEVASVILFLGSAANTVLTGEIVRASGGRK